MVISTIAEWTKNIQKKENFRMTFFQLTSIYDDTTIIDADTLTSIPSSIK